MKLTDRDGKLHWTDSDHVLIKVNRRTQGLFLTVAGLPPEAGRRRLRLPHEGKSLVRTEGHDQATTARA